jgi:hypothetical protein
MNVKRLVAGAVLPALLACGCSNLSHTENGALLGGGLGAATGALIGKATGHTAGGALIGAGVGAVSGGLVGNAVEKSEQKAEAKAVAQAQAQAQLSMGEVIQMAQNHISDDVIINQIRTRGTVFYLSAQDIVMLKQNGVSDRVVAEMQATATRVPRRVYSATPVYTQPVYVVEPPPPPPVVRFGYTHYGRW